MLILPFIHKVINQQTFNINIIKFLTIGGNIIWEENDNLDIDNDILNPNDIYCKTGVSKYDKKLFLCEVDTIKTDITNFYVWDEVDATNSDLFCWRTYYYITGSTKSNWLAIPDREKIGKYNVKDLINTVIKNKDII
jgi:hypothetical protein